MNKVASGFTVIVNSIGVPTFEFPSNVKVGVTSMVAVWADNDVLVAVNPLIVEEDPLAANSLLEIEILLFDHSYVVVPPVFWVEKIISSTSSKLQTTILLFDQPVQVD